MAIFKIFRSAEWAILSQNGEFQGSSDDLRDGFIHFSTETQISGTLAKYYSDYAEIIIAVMEPARWGEALKWESSRGGQLFPHLYAPIIESDVKAHWLLQKKPSEGWSLDDIARDLNISFAPSDI